MKTKVSFLHKGLACLPGCHWYNLIGFYLHVSLAAGSISWKNVIHNFKELLNALVLPEVFSSFHKKGIFPLIIASDNYTFRFPNGLHYFYLWQNVEEEKYRADKTILLYKLTPKEATYFYAAPEIKPRNEILSWVFQVLSPNVSLYCLFLHFVFVHRMGLATCNL